MGRLPVPLPVVLPLLFRFRLQPYVSLDLSMQDCGTYCSSVMLVLAPCFTVGDVPVSCLRRSYICLLRRGILALASGSAAESHP